MAAHEVYSPEDTIKPTKFEHLVEEGFKAGTFEFLFRYNFLRYEFSHPKGAIWARSYLDQTDHVSIYLPEGVSLEDDTVQRVIAYLRRRYPDIQHLTKKGYVSIFPKPKKKKTSRTRNQTR